MSYDYPRTVSLGTAYTGVDRLLLAIDVRYLGWDDTDTTGDSPGFAPDGRVTGLGWRDSWSINLGAQYEICDCLAVRAGYAYGTSPITDEYAGFNVGAPLILEHSLSAGATLNLSDTFAVNFAYYYAPPSTVSGNLQGPTGPLAGTSVEYEVQAHAVSVGMSAKF